jgi:acylphosphatase
MHYNLADIATLPVLTSTGSGVAKAVSDICNTEWGNSITAQVVRIGADGNLPDEIFSLETDGSAFRVAEQWIRIGSTPQERLEWEVHRIQLLSDQVDDSSLSSPAYIGLKADLDALLINASAMAVSMGSSLCLTPEGWIAAKSQELREGDRVRVVYAMASQGDRLSIQGTVRSTYDGMVRVVTDDRPHTEMYFPFQLRALPKSSATSRINELQSEIRFLEKKQAEWKADGYKPGWLESYTKATGRKSNKTATYWNHCVSRDGRVRKKAIPKNQVGEYQRMIARGRRIRQAQLEIERLQREIQTQEALSAGRSIRTDESKMEVIGDFVIWDSRRNFVEGNFAGDSFSISIVKMIPRAQPRKGLKRSKPFKRFTKISNNPAAAAEAYEKARDYIQSKLIGKN